MARKPLIEAGSFLPPGSDLQTRIIAKDAEKHGRTFTVRGTEDVESTPSLPTDTPGTQEYDKSYDKSDYAPYDNTTNKSDDKPESIKESIKERKQARRSENREASGHSSQAASIRDAIIASMKQGEPKEETLKTVTLKLAPSLDRKVEDHCHVTGRKKQDVVRDALLLYFETVEAAIGGNEDL